MIFSYVSGHSDPAQAPFAEVEAVRSLDQAVNLITPRFEQGTMGNLRKVIILLIRLIRLVRFYALY